MSSTTHFTCVPIQIAIEPQALLRVEWRFPGLLLFCTDLLLAERLLKLRGCQLDVTDLATLYSTHLA